MTGYTITIKDKVFENVLSVDTFVREPENLYITFPDDRPLSDIATDFDGADSLIFDDGTSKTVYKGFRKLFFVRQNINGITDVILRKP